MAEVALKIGDSDTYKDGDILCAFNRRRVRCVHAEHLCKVGLAAGVPRGTDTMAQRFRERTSQYRFERLSHTEIDRVDLATSKRQRFGSPDIDVPLYVTRRLRHPKHLMFGAVGAEAWYGGKRDVGNAKLDLVWADIEEHTARREAEDEFALWPAGYQDIREHLFVRMDEFSDEEAVAMVTPKYDDVVIGPDDPEMIAKRARKIDWRANVLPTLGVTEAQVLDARYAIGDDVTFPSGATGHRSKAQPEKPTSVVVVKPTGAGGVSLPR